MRRVSFFIDGFNVYHAISNYQYSRYKWLDYSALAKCFITSTDVIEKIYYFTAYAHWDKEKKSRHEIFIKALRSKNVEIVFGKFKVKDKKCRICKKTYQTFEEKQTDVNISIKMFLCAHHDSFDTAILITGDSDLIPAVRAVQDTFPDKKIGLVIPIGKTAEELKQVCDYHMKMKEKHLSGSQFPEEITLDPIKNIILKKPATWR